jgi:glycosyltransferase involved in cell wall biosynthesis
MPSSGDGQQEPRLVVVVPARNEADRLGDCLASLTRQDVPVKVFVSDNASRDGTAEVAGRFAADLDMVVRTTPSLEAVEHFVSAGRWALEAAPDAELFALLAGDDAWSAGFARASLDALEESPTDGAVFPAFEWEGDDAPRRLLPIEFRHADPGTRQSRALRLSDRRELSNLVYGVYRRAAFVDLLGAFERGGNRFGVDYAAAWHVLGSYQVGACAQALGLRHVRADADLLQRAGFRRADATGLLGTAVMYVRLNLRINRLLAEALQRVDRDRPGQPPAWKVQVLRAPQWFWGAVRQSRGA